MNFLAGSAPGFYGRACPIFRIQIQQGESTLIFGRQVSLLFRPVLFDAACPFLVQAFRDVQPSHPLDRPASRRILHP
jgi:hypothetical protein